LVGDAAEERAMFDLFGSNTQCNSTKGFTGHTLGASGVVEALICALAIQHGFLPGSPHTASVDPGFRCRYVRQTEDAPPDLVVTNSFGFGGVNCSLVLGRAR
jgi:3-oxoacyl-[acyl-carrier-protein] synthase-1